MNVETPTGTANSWERPLSLVTSSVASWPLLSTSMVHETVRTLMVGVMLWMCAAESGP